MTIVKMVDDAAKKVLAEGFAGEYEEGDDWSDDMDDQEVSDYWGEEVPQHVRDEAKVEEAIERRHDQRQMDMYNDEMWNWSGLQ